MKFEFIPDKKNDKSKKRKMGKHKLAFVIDEKNQNKLTINLDVDLDKFRVKDTIWRESDYFEDYDGDDEIPPVFVQFLEKILGVERVGYDKYSISIFKGEMFDWKKLAIPILARLELELIEGNDFSHSGDLSSMIEKKEKTKKYHKKLSKKMQKS